MLKRLLLLLCLLPALPSLAYNVKSGVISYTTYTDGTCVVTSCDKEYTGN